jgi:D-arabinitol 4-dehydrogenase
MIFLFTALGITDMVPVMSEAFCQWVIEDKFVDDQRPAWEKVGTQLVDSVVPYEEAKIRILNASHSCCAWAGTLLNLKYIAESVAVPEIRQFVEDYVSKDVIPCLTPSPVDLIDYRNQILKRFSNAFLYDTNERVAADGFSKIPGFILPTLVECLGKIDDAALPRSTALLCALFFRFLERWHRGTLPYIYQVDFKKPPIIIYILQHV